MDNSSLLIAYLASGGTLFFSCLLLSFYRAGRVLRTYAFAIVCLTSGGILPIVSEAIADSSIGASLDSIFLSITILLVYCGTISYFENKFIWSGRFTVYTVLIVLYILYISSRQFPVNVESLYMVLIQLILYADFYRYIKSFFNDISNLIKTAFSISIFFGTISCIAKSALALYHSTNHGSALYESGFINIIMIVLFILYAILWFSTGIMLEYSGELNEMAEKNRQLKTMAERDVLTGLYNRNKLEQRLPNILSVAERLKTPISFIIMDIDHFKEVNDRYGHAAGDRILIHLANILRRNVRESDMVFRWGGEEFLVLAVGAPMNGAFVLAEHLRVLIEAENFESAGHITASFGIAETSYLGPKDNWFERVDAALYKAKESGRNRVICWDETVQLRNSQPPSEQLEEIATLKETQYGPGQGIKEFIPFL